MEIVSKQISVLHRLSEIYVNKKLKAYGLSQSQINALLFLAKNEDVNQNQIKEYLGLDKGTVSAMIKKLVANGFVQKLNHPNDKRSIFLRLSYKSSLLLKQLEDVNYNLTSGILQGFDSDEKKEVLSYLKRMQENVETLHTY